MHELPPAIRLLQCSDVEEDLLKLEAKFGFGISTHAQLTSICKGM